MISRVTLERSAWPILVRIGLLGIPNQALAWAFALGTLVLAIVFLSKESFVAGVAFLLASAWYYLAIRWVNQHGSWN